ncbi:MAG: histidine phosphatase family protein [Desulfobulbaceae bacterium]|nr:MAG: histidine phosphatase family protein [Desulfobulbaceae bacterium]
MKTLCLLRHAKSSWKSSALNDFDRPLNNRGKSDAPSMARRLAAYAFAPELIVASPAKRTSKTALIFAEVLGYPEERIIYNEDIYTADLAGLVAVLRGINAGVDRVLLVGHNPFITILGEWLSGGKFVNIPTCGLVGLGLPLDSWQEIQQGDGKVLFYDYPKKIATP